MSSLFKASILLTIFFGINKLVALLRQTLIAQEFGFSAQIDAFNVANNLPDLVFSLFSGGALALAFIPVFAEYIQEYGRVSSWKLFSKTANILFIVTALLSVIFAIAAKPLVAWKFGISPGFSASTQELVVELMRINLVATLIFSLSGLVMASLQAHKHFLLPAISPILYNVGLIIGTVVLAPATGIHIAGVSLPAFGLGIHGLVYGTVLGALLHLLIQIPGIVQYQFSWTPSFDLKDTGVQKVLRLALPRIATVFLIQLIFLARDNLASYLEEGSVTVLTYGYFIMQVPETLIGTAIATALLPTLSELVSKKRQEEFAQTLNRSLSIIVATTLAISISLSIALPYLIEALFNFNKFHTELLAWTTRGYLVGLLGHSLLEIVARAFYAQQNAKLPLAATFLRTILFMLLTLLFFKSSGAIGLAIADSVAVTAGMLLLLFMLYRRMPSILPTRDTIIRSIAGCATMAVIIFAVFYFVSLPPLPLVLLALLLGGSIYLLFIRQELKMVVKL